MTENFEALQNGETIISICSGHGHIRIRLVIDTVLTP